MIDPKDSEVTKRENCPWQDSPSMGDPDTCTDDDNHHVKWKYRTCLWGSGSTEQENSTRARVEFLNLSTIDYLGPGNSLLVLRGFPVYCRVVNSIPCFCPLDASSTTLCFPILTPLLPSPQLWWLKSLQTLTNVTWGTKLFPVENHWSRKIQTCIKE